jgi:hypothetical protein
LVYIISKEEYKEDSDDEDWCTILGQRERWRGRNWQEK